MYDLVRCRVWFEACDGIFTNYAWSEREVAASAALAGPRLPHLYIGLDVWGRNFLGGGKFNTQQVCAFNTYHTRPEKAASFNGDKKRWLLVKRRPFAGKSVIVKEYLWHKKLSRLQRMTYLMYTKKKDGTQYTSLGNSKGRVLLFSIDNVVYENR